MYHWNRRIGWILIGALLLALLVCRSGLIRTASDLVLIGRGLAVVIALEFLVDAFHTLGWWLTFPAELRIGTLPKLFFVRLAGTALNAVLPAGSVGGEPTKVYLLKRDFPVPTIIATVVTSSLIFSLSKAGFIMMGTVLTLRRFELSYELSLAVLVGFLVTLGALTAFLFLQLCGFNRAATGIITWMPIPEQWAATLRRVLPDVDSEISAFFNSRPGDVALAVCSHQFAFVCGVVQVLLLLGWLGLPRSIGNGVAIESFAMLLGFVTFMVPGGLGVQEGGKVVIFAALGLPAAAGVTVGIAFRLVSIVGSAAGLIALTVLKLRTPELTASVESVGGH